MSDQVRKVRVMGRTDRNRYMDPAAMPMGYEVEAEYHSASTEDRDAVLAFVERIVRTLEGADKAEGNE